MALRERKGLKQKDIAGFADMSQANYSDIERGITKPSIEHLIKFAEILEITIDDLISNDFTDSRKVYNGGKTYFDVIEEKNKRIEFLEQLVLILIQSDFSHRVKSIDGMEI